MREIVAHVAVIATVASTISCAGDREGKGGEVVSNLVTTVAVATVLGTGVLAGEPLFSTWRGDTSLAGASKEQISDNLTKLWQFRAGAPVQFVPVVGDGKVFVVNSRSQVTALDLMKGTSVWSKAIELPSADTNTPPQRVSLTAPPAYAFGTLVVASDDGGILAYDGKDGSLKWTATVGAPVRSTPNFVDLGKDGWLVVIMTQPKEEGVLTAFEGGTGKEKWRTESYGQADGHISIAGKRIAFGACDATIHVLSAIDGKDLVGVPLGSGFEIAGGVAFAGKMVYSGSRSGALCAVDIQKKELLWTYDVGAGELFTTPAANDRFVVFSGGNGSVTALDLADPKKAKWEFDAGGMRAESPLIVGERVVVSIDGKVRILDLADGKKVIWTSPSLGDGVTAPAIAGGMVIVGSDSGSVTAFGEKPAETTGPK